MPAEAQAKLLDFVETGRYRRLGESKRRKADVRIIAATNRDVEEAIKEGKFRKDLYYRLSVHRIKIPPLRKREEDIEALIEHYRPLLKGRELTGEAIDYILSHPLPGNCRQLINALTRLGLKMDCPQEISLEEIKEILPAENHPQEPADIIEALWRKIKEGGNFWDVVKKPFLSRDLNRSQVKGFLRQGLARAEGRWKNLCSLLNLEEGEYHKFMTFLHDYKLKP